MINQEGYENSLFFHCLLRRVLKLVCIIQSKTFYFDFLRPTVKS